MTSGTDGLISSLIGIYSIFGHVSNLNVTFKTKVDDWNSNEYHFNLKGLVLAYIS